MEKLRLSKLMSQRGICSRREADALIERGWVFVDGERVSTLGLKVDPESVVTLDPRALASRAKLVTILLNKPIGYVSGQPEPGKIPAIALINAASRFPGDRSGIEFTPEHLMGIAPAGRLDIDSQGLLVFTQDGAVAKTLVGVGSGVEKEYIVRVEGVLSPEGLRLLNHGLSIDGDELLPAEVSWLNRDQLRFVLRQGKKRQIRRMCELVGLQAVGLKRVRIGKVMLGNLPEGMWRYLGEDERFA